MLRVTALMLRVTALTLLRGALASDCDTDTYYASVDRTPVSYTHLTLPTICSV